MNDQLRRPGSRPPGSEVREPQAPGFSYARSADGTSIAYMRLGSGPPLVVLPPIPLSNVSGDWSIPLMRDVFSRLAIDFDLILFDGRGTGASQRAVADFSIEAQMADLDAVLDDAGVGPVALMAIYLACPAAVTYAARQPDRVTRLVLFGATTSARKSLDRPGTSALLGLIDEDWELFTKTAALDWMGWGVGEAGQLVAESFRTATTPDIAKAAFATFARSDLSPILDDVAADTLVLHRREGRQIPLEQSAELAAAIPGGRLHVLDGDSATLFFDDPAGTVDVIADFVIPGWSRRSGSTDPQASPAGVAPSPDMESSAGSGAPLTTRESEVLRLIAAGDSNAEIAHRLGLSVHTVERHAANIYRKIGARGRADATGWALRNGLG